MVPKLLEKGCSLDDIWTANGSGNESVWQRFMAAAHKARDYASKPSWEIPLNNRNPNKRAEQARVVFVTFLLKHGADPDAKYKIGSRVVLANSYETREFLMWVLDGDQQKVDALQKEARKVRSAAVEKKPACIDEIVPDTTVT